MCNRIAKIIRYCPAIVTVLAVVHAPDIGAQPIVIDPEAQPASLIEFKAEQGLGDFVGRAEGTVDGNGKRFYLKGLDVMSPLVIYVFAKDTAKPIDVSLHRFMWRDANESGRTDEYGDWSFVGRVQDEVGIELKAADPSEFYLLAWRGQEQPTDFGANLYIPASPAGSQSDQDGGSGGVPWLAMTVVISIAVVAIAYLALKFRGSQQAAAMLAYFAVGIALPTVDTNANPLNANWGARLAAVEANLELEVQGFNERFAVVAEEMQKRREAESKLKRSLTENTAIIAERLAEHDAAIAMTNEQMATMSGLIAERLAGIDGDIANLYMLVEQDRTAVPDPTFGGVAPMPSTCFADLGASSGTRSASGATTGSFESECGQCFNAANEKLIEQMRLYEELRSIYSTNRSFAEYVVMTGDAISGFHQLEQAAWYGIKLDIRQAQMNVTRAYNAKFDEFNQKLDGILREFGQCEAMNGNDDWYRRHGTLFYNALINSYRVHDDTELPF